MGTSTPAPLTLYKPDDGELVDVEVHLGDNYDKMNDWAILRQNARYEFLGGLERDDDSVAVDDDPEFVFCTSGGITLPESSLIEVQARCDLFLTGSTAADWIFRIRETNLAGAIKRQLTRNFGGVVSIPLSVEFSMRHKTTTADSKTWVATVQRLNGSGTLTAQAGSSVTAWRAGLASLMGTYTD